MYVRSYEDPHFTLCFAPDDTTEVTKEKLLQLLDAADNPAEQPCDELLGRSCRKRSTTEPTTAEVQPGPSSA